MNNAGIPDKHVEDAGAELAPLEYTPGSAIALTQHQMRAQAIAWADAPVEAAAYHAEYDAAHGKTVALWVDGTGNVIKPAKAYFDMAANERGMVLTFAECYGSRDVARLAGKRLKGEDDAR